jgi:hypothetical protein
MQITRANMLHIALMVIGVLIIVYAAGDHKSSDLYATWLAGEFFAKGDLANVYPMDDTVFTMRPPEAWVALDRARGGDDDLFPFIYPPLWAALASYLTPLTSFETVAGTAVWINAALIVGMVALAGRVTGPALAFPIFLITGVTLIFLSLAGIVAIWENQPQILVSFLIVLAIERARFGRDIQAGGVLALAAAIKLYPVFFVLIWLASRRFSAIAGFAVAGAALGVLSIVLAGWPLHQMFLHQISTISDTILITQISYNLDTLIAHLTVYDQFQYIERVQANAPSGASDLAGWNVYERPFLWGLLSKLALLAALAAIYLAARRVPEPCRSTALWPAAVALIALLSPITWSYHFLALFAFLPALIVHFGARLGTVIIAVTITPILLPVAALYSTATFVPSPLQLTGTLSMIALLIAFACACRAPSAKTSEIPAS